MFATPKSSLLDYLLGLIGIRKYTLQKIHHARHWKACKHRALVWLIPQHTFWKITWLPSDLNARTIKRMTYRDERCAGWNTLVHLADDNTQIISLGRENEDAHVELKKTDFDVLMALATAQSVTTRMLGMKYTDPVVLAMVGQYFRKGETVAVDPSRVGKPTLPQVHWPLSSEAEEPETSFRSYSAPVVSDQNVVPAIKRWETMSLSVDRRVTIVRNIKIPHKRFQTLAEEFVCLVVPEPSVGVPLSLEDTVSALDKPSQVLAIKQIWETADTPVRKLIEAFVKNEPTNKNGRIISAFNDARFLLKMSSYTLSFRNEVLHAEHNKHWFCPGSTPEQIAQRVVEYCSEVVTPIEGDYSNMDGTVSDWLQRHVMNATYHRWFHPTVKPELLVFTDMLISCPARAKKFGFQYEAGVGVKSGSPTTCDMNTVLNAFIQYSSIRMTNPDLKPSEAFQQIGLCFGDDSLFDQQYSKAFAKTAASVGMELKVERPDPSKGVTFLARVFVDPTITTTSMQDPLRTWRKLHLTSRDPNIPIASAAIDRVSGYLVTDGLSPITADYCRMIVRLYEPTAETKEKRDSRKTVDREKPYWLTYGGAWPQDPADAELMMQVTAARTGIDEAVLRMTQRTLETTNDIWSAQITVNRDEEPVALVDTLDAEAQPVGRVDDRQLKHDQYVNNQNSQGPSSRPPKRNRGNGQPHCSANVSVANSRGSRRERRGGFHQVPRGYDDKTSSFNREPAVEAQNGGTPRPERTIPRPDHRGPKFNGSFKTAQERRQSGGSAQPTRSTPN
jgi:hypothetical protein